MCVRACVPVSVRVCVRVYLSLYVCARIGMYACACVCVWRICVCALYYKIYAFNLRLGLTGILHYSYPSSYVARIIINNNE